MGRVDLDIAREIGDETNKYMEALNLLKQFLDDGSRQRVHDYISGMSDARGVIHRRLDADVAGSDLPTEHLEPGRWQEGVE